MRRLTPFLFLVILTACEQKAAEPQITSAPVGEAEQTQTTPSTSNNNARDQAQKLWAYIDNSGRAKQAAFIDSMLQNEEMYNEIYKPLQKEVGRTIINFHSTPAFAPYEPCLDAANALTEFAELRRDSKGENNQTDGWRLQFLDKRKQCEQALAS